MPYSAEHKRATRARIVESARHLFNRRGFTQVSIDDVMANAGLTRGGFYNHFKNKDALYIEVLAAFAAEREADAASQPCGRREDMALRILQQYVSREHLEDLDGQCPLIALPSDVARAGPPVRAAYRQVLEAMALMFQSSLDAAGEGDARRKALTMAATCVGAMVLARTVDDEGFADEICAAVRISAEEMLGPSETDERRVA